MNIGLLSAIFDEIQGDVPVYKFGQAVHDPSAHAFFLHDKAYPLGICGNPSKRVMISEAKDRQAAFSQELFTVAHPFQRRGCDGVTGRYACGKA